MNSNNFKVILFHIFLSQFYEDNKNLYKILEEYDNIVKNFNIFPKIVFKKVLNDTDYRSLIIIKEKILNINEAYNLIKTKISKFKKSANEP